MDQWLRGDWNLGLVTNWILALSVLSIWILVGWFLANLFFRRLGRWSSHVIFQFESTLLKSLPLPLYMLIVISGVNVALTFAPLSANQLRETEKVFEIILFFVGIYVVDQMLQGLLMDLEKRQQDLKDSHFMFSAILRLIVWSIGLMVVLESLGVSITPLLASLGVGSLAVALALQSTLANLFSGMYLLLDKPIRVGQFVQLTTGEKGTIEAIGWRSTRIRLLANNMMVIPNSKLAENQILNYHLPDTECSVTVEVGVDYPSDLNHVEKVTLEVARLIQKTVPGAVATFDPFIRFHTLSASSINFTVILRAQEFVTHYLIKHEFIKALHQRCKVEKITLHKEA